MSAQEFKNEDISVTVSKKPGCHVDLLVNITPAAANKAYLEAIKAVGRETLVPGFRKGRAPEAMVVKQYGSQIDREWREQILTSTFRDAVKLIDILPYRQESINSAKIVSLSREEGGILKYEFESMPEVPAIDMSKISVEQIAPTPVAAEQIDKILEDIRYQHADWNDAAERAVVEGDFVDVDVVNLESDETILTDTRLEVADGKIGQWLKKLLIGLKPGENAEGVSEQEEGQDHPDFKPVRCRITIKAIKESVLPQVNDELAVKAGVASIDELKARIAKDLEKMSAEEAQRQLRDKLTTTVLKAYHFDLPESLVKEMAQNAVQQRAREIAEMHRGAPDLQDKMRAMESEVLAELSEVLRWHFITRKIAQEEKIEVTQPELIRKMMLSRYYGNAQTDEDNDSLYSRMYAEVLSDKVADFLLESMKSLKSA